MTKIFAELINKIERFCDEFFIFISYCKIVITIQLAIIASSNLMHLLFPINIFLGIAASVVGSKKDDEDLLRKSSKKTSKQTFTLGSCKLVVNKPCPDENVKFFLYNQQFPEFSQEIRVGDSMADSNLLETMFDPKQPVKIIIHGYNSDMTLGALVEIRKRKLSSSYSLL